MDRGGYTERGYSARGLLAAVMILSSFSVGFSQKSNDRSYYHEDLYPLRPKFNEVIDTVQHTEHRPKERVIPVKNVNTRVNNVLDSINRFNITRKFIDGYTIQIYSGQNREEAMNAKKKMNADPGLNGILEYNQPKFRVRVGNYYSRLEAQRDLQQLKTIFPNAILVPEKILVR
ncbi:MAG: SPOR domain-containing protein [Cytophagales bacterium]|nr:SPOR domain-containing protein [Cytophagales bacterium]